MILQLPSRGQISSDLQPLPSAFRDAALHARLEKIWPCVSLSTCMDSNKLLPVPWHPSFLCGGALNIKPCFMKGGKRKSTSENCLLIASAMNEFILICIRKLLVREILKL